MKSGRIYGQGMWHVRQTGEVYTGIWYRKRTLGRPTHRWEENIKIDLEVVGWGVMIWIGLA